MSNLLFVVTFVVGVRCVCPIKLSICLHTQLSFGRGYDLLIKHN